MNFFLAILGLRKQIAFYLEKKIGAPSEQIIIITTMSSVIPFSLLNYYIKNRTARLYYSLIVGFIIHYSIYGMNSLHTIFGTICSYFYTYFFGRKFSPFYLLIGSLAHLSFLNIRRMIEDFGGWNIDDISTLYMVAIAKFSSVCFSYSDGNKDPKDIKNDHIRSTMIIEMPSLLEYASYVFFYPTTLIGPFIEYKDFINFIDQKDCYINLQQKLGYICKQGAKTFSIAILFILIFTFFGDKFPMDAVGTSEFRKKYPIWWMRFLYMFACGPIGRSKYYIGWSLTYSSLIFSGMAYGEEINKEGKIIPNVDKGSYGSILFIEFGMNPIYKMVYWNNSIHIWLKYNVYIRALMSSGILKNNRLMANFITYAVSAVWHGFYISYYISFFAIFLFEQGALFLNEIGFYNYVNEHKFLWPFISLKTAFFINSIGSIFYCLQISTTKEILINFYGLPFSAIICFYLITMYFRPYLNKKKKKKEENKIKEEGEKIINKKNE